MKVAILTSGGIAPCLSASVGNLVQRYTDLDPSVEIICYSNGYQGLLLGKSIKIDSQAREQAHILLELGGSPIGNSRVKLSNTKDCIKRSLIKENENPFEVAAKQLIKDKVDVIHTIGGDDTSTTAAELSEYLKKNSYDLCVVGLPKTIDNDIVPVAQSLGALTAAEQGAIFFENIVSEYSSNPKTLIVHEVMGRNCGWLTAATAENYLQRLNSKALAPAFGANYEKRNIHGIFIPEIDIDLQKEANRLKNIMDEVGCVNIFVSEGAFANVIIQEMESSGEEISRDAFGHVKLDKVNVGKWIGKRLSKLINAEKVLVQKSGYFVRSAPANKDDLRLIQSCADLAVECAFKKQSGLIGHDEDQQNILRCIEFNRVKGGKKFDVKSDWFKNMMAKIS